MSHANCEMVRSVESAPALALNAATQAKRLRSDEYLFIDGLRVQRHIDRSAAEISSFKEEWGRLTLDKYMGDGGKYRYRRYGQFEKTSDLPRYKQLPHEPYMQSKEINQLNGDVGRMFEPLTKEFTRSPVLAGVLDLLGNIYDYAVGSETDWNVRLHPYRIVATHGQSGLPTPEGLHRDGVTYIASMMINRRGVYGGVTTLTDAAKNIKKKIELASPFDLLLSNDETTMHSVSKIEPVKIQEPGVRDVLVIAFTRTN